MLHTEDTRLYQSFNDDGSGGQPDPNDKEGKSQGGNVKNPPKLANGGWISGPQSGYRVSLDGGRSTSFIGHGREYVARKANGGFSSFLLILWNKNATKLNLKEIT